MISVLHQAFSLSLLMPVPPSASHLLFIFCPDPALHACVSAFNTLEEQASPMLRIHTRTNCCFGLLHASAVVHHRLIPSQ